MQKKVLGTIIALTVISLSSQAFAGSYVNGYTRQDGTYVQGYFRSAPDGQSYNNYSTYGNTNPYTGKRGSVR